MSSSIDVLKHFALIEFKNEPGTFGVAFAVLRENHDLFLVAKGSSSNQVNVFTIHSSTIEFKHYSKWEEIMNAHEDIQCAFTYAYHSTPEDWPCGFARTIFDVKVNPTNTVHTHAT